MIDPHVFLATWTKDLDDDFHLNVLPGSCRTLNDLSGGGGVN
ncbi:hypothetical protein HMPREF0083_05558 [Aneurinibacillus aneurinilyticus ATCC 12856]|uniref:Uncharacterized protein n=1 Tax=Aneurinibacillus aneurinilyticus ATCC 12856 TaxID=649747 RepID=U1Y470_ANEAE|nr:hypothetical protein HMPREF0083_05558 [Aneurinibacillus aneurinilyticus ATCC 12856]